MMVFFTEVAMKDVVAIIVSVCALGVSAWSLKSQRKHNILSVKPIPEITILDQEGLLRVEIKNHGSGPLFINSLRVLWQEKEYSSLIDCCGYIGDREWANYSGAIDGRSILPTKGIVLLELIKMPREVDFNIPKDLARYNLEMASISIEYTDVYGSNFSAYTKKFDWSGRLMTV